MLSLRVDRGRRWSFNGWNNRFSLSLFRALTPRVPEILRPTAQWVLALACYAAMRPERRASLANLKRVTGEGGGRLKRQSLRLFYNFSRLMVSRLELGSLTMQELQARVVNLEEARARLASVLGGGGGAVVATAHLGNWEMGMRLLRLSGRPVHVVMKVDGDAGVEAEYQRLRASEGLRIHWLGVDPLLSVTLLTALRRGDLVAVQADRDAGAERTRVRLFGQPTWLPLGPARLARAAEVPVLPCFVLMDRGKRLKVCIGDPIRIDSSVDSEAGIRHATRALARAIEAAVAEAPEQWFNFYPIWESNPSAS